MRDLSIIIPSFHSKVLTTICIKSFLKFCPNNVKLYFIIVENSDDISYRDEIKSLSRNLLWVNNQCLCNGSEANASGLKRGIDLVTTDLVFMAHCDICVTHSSFFENILIKYDDGAKAVAMARDKHPNRIHALHILGLLTETSIVKNIDLDPKYKNNVQVMDVGDDITRYCRDNNLKHYCFDNSYNNLELSEMLNAPYNDFLVLRSINDDGNVIFMHLARGISKMKGTYRKPNRVTITDWQKFCDKIIGGYHENSI